MYYRASLVGIIVDNYAERGRLNFINLGQHRRCPKFWPFVSKPHPLSSEQLGRSKWVSLMFSARLIAKLSFVVLFSVAIEVTCILHSCAIIFKGFNNDDWRYCFIAGIVCVYFLRDSIIIFRVKGRGRGR